jgi:hypothetical protein
MGPVRLVFVRLRAGGVRRVIAFPPRLPDRLTETGPKYLHPMQTPSSGPEPYHPASGTHGLMAGMDSA